MKRWLVIVNRAAGRRPIEPAVVREATEAAGVDGQVIAPASVEETVSVIETEARAGRTHFALAGGDGTVNLAINTLLSLDMGETPVVGVLPTGTGCDLLRTFGLPHALGAAARHLTGDETYDIDVVTLQGAWGRRFFVNVAQVGVGAAAAETAPRITRRIGSARYPLAFLARLPRFPQARIRLTTEKRTYESEALAVIMANAQFFAGGWNVAPRATLVDGVLDIQIINARKSQAPALVPKIVRGTHLKDGAVRRLVAAEFKIESDPVWPLEADGDPVGSTTVEGRVVPSAIRLKI
ncbi:MAG: diacylglycerol/lipid kinase family protein [Acidimicrobiia bacterium]